MRLIAWVLLVAAFIFAAFANRIPDERFDEQTTPATVSFAR